MSEDNKDYYIVKNFKFNNFLQSQSFVNKVGEIAERSTSSRYMVWFGDTLKLRYKLMQLMDYTKVISFLLAKIDKIT